MNRGRFIGGVVCVSVAMLLAVLAVALPEDKMVFMVGDTNVPYLPAIVLGVVGVALLVTSGALAQASGPALSPERERESVDPAASRASAEPTVGDDPISEDKAQLNKQLERMGWGAFLIMLGGFALIPDDVVPGGLWPIGLGLIWLGLNAARYSRGIKMSGFTTFLGAVAVVSGALELLGVNDVGGAIFLIVLGAYVILKPSFDKRGLFGKAEDS